MRRAPAVGAQPSTTGALGRQIERKPLSPAAPLPPAKLKRGRLVRSSLVLGCLLAARLWLPLPLLLQALCRCCRRVGLPAGHVGALDG